MTTFFKSRWSIGDFLYKDHGNTGCYKLFNFFNYPSLSYVIFGRSWQILCLNFICEFLILLFCKDFCFVQFFCVNYEFGIPIILKEF